MCVRVCVCVCVLTQWRSGITFIVPSQEIRVIFTWVRLFYRAGFTNFLQDMLSLALPCILIIFSKAVFFSKFPRRY